MPKTRDQALKFFEDAAKDLPKFAGAIKPAVELMLDKAKAKDYQGLVDSLAELNTAMKQAAIPVKPYVYSNFREAISVLCPDFDPFDDTSPAEKISIDSSNLEEFFTQKADLYEYVEFDIDKVSNETVDIAKSVARCIEPLLSLDKTIADFLEAING